MAGFVHLDITKGILQYCTEDDTIVKLQAYLKNGNDINAPWTEIHLLESTEGRVIGNTALHVAVALKRTNVVNYLLNEDANVSLKNSEGKSAIDLALQRSHLNTNYIHEDSKDYLDDFSIYDIIKKRCLAKWKDKGPSELHMSCSNEKPNSKFASRILESGGINHRVRSDSPIWATWTPLHIAARYDNEEMVNWLLDHGADPSIRNSEGDTPLHLRSFAQYWRYRLIPRLYIFENDTFGTNGLSHFHMACLNNDNPESLAIVEEFLKSGHSCDLEARKPVYEYFTNFESSTGLHLVTYSINGSPELAKLLLEYGTEVDKVDGRGETALYRLCRQHHDAERDNLAELLPVLLEAGGNIEFECSFNESSSKTPLSFLSVPPLMIFALTPSLLYASIVVKHIKRVLMLGFSFNERSLKYYQRLVDLLQDFNEENYEELCRKELKDLEDNQLKKVLLTNKKDDLVKYSIDKKFQSLIDLSDFNERFPIYGYLLKLKFKQGKHLRLKKLLITEATLSFSELLENQYRLPFLCGQRIMLYMSTRDLKQVISATRD